MAFKILSPEEAKKRVRADIAEWEKQKEKEEKKGRLNSERKSREESEESSSSNRKKTKIVKGSKRQLKPKQQENLNKQLYEAAFFGNVKLVQELIKKGADVNAKFQDNWTALINVARSNFIEFAEILIANGADVNAIANDNITALSVALKRGNIDMADMLRKHGAVE